MRVLICGGRDFSDAGLMDRALTIAHKNCAFDVVIHGAARGADSMGAEWASKHGIATLAFPADWNKHGKAAGPIRNQRMLDEGKPELVIAFAGGNGTADMVRRAKAHPSVVGVMEIPAQSMNSRTQERG